MRRRLRLLRYARPYKGDLVRVFLTLVAGTVLSLLTPWPVKLLVDNVLGEKPLSGWSADVFERLPGATGDEQLLLWVAIASVTIFALQNVFEGLNAVASIKLGQRMTYDLAADVFAHLQRLSLRFHSRQPVGDTLARTNADTFAVHALVSSVAVPVLQAVLTLGLMFAVMYALSPGLTLLALAVVPVQLLAIVAFGRPMRVRSRRRLDLEGRMLAVVEQSLTSVPVVQAFTREQIDHSRFRKLADRTIAAYVAETVTGVWFKALVGAVTAAGTAAIIYVGGRLALDGDVTPGTIIVFLTYLAGLYVPLDNIAYTAAVYQAAAAQTDRVLEVLESTPDVTERPHAKRLDRPRGHIRFEDVSFAYDPGRPVLKNVAAEIQPGEVVAVVGPTGAGKSTLVGLLLRFFDPDTGRVTIDGMDLRDLRLRSLRRQVAIVMQDPFILPLSVHDNITYGRPRATREEVVAAAVAANAHEFIERLPDGYDTVVGERGATLSGGEKQRLSIARAFLKSAPILILDEPTSALDARTEGALLDALARLREGRTAIVIAHRLSTIRDADRILVLEHGEIVEQGRHDELVALDGLYASLYNQQVDVARHVAAEDGAPASQGLEQRGVERTHD